MSEALKPLSGQKTISVTNTAEKLDTTSRVIAAVAVKNTSAAGTTVRVGDSSVGATGYPLASGEGIAFDSVDPSLVYVYGPSGATVAWFELVV